MTLQEKLGVLYGICHCMNRSCSNCTARRYCAEMETRDALWEEVLNEAAALTKETDKAKDMLIKNLPKAEQCLIDNGIESDEAPTVLHALGYILLDKELYPDNY